MAASSLPFFCSIQLARGVVAPLGTTCRTPWGQACPHQGRAAARSTHSAATPAGCEFTGQRAAGTLGSSSAAPGRRYASGLGATVVTLPRGPPLSWLHPRAQHDPATTARRFCPASLALASRPFGRCSIGHRSLRPAPIATSNSSARSMEFSRALQAMIDPATMLHVQHRASASTLQAPHHKLHQADCSRGTLRSPKRPYQ